ncbi:UbiD family decarboxylase [Aneurinibacillus sp. REN35]|uniref:UbiD family decarboxylase n=1 Tax=Aneurinibacillus sp. REN35 TaxID=3237286 RepID=UPI003527034E
MNTSIRKLIDHWDRTKQLIHIQKEVDPLYELGAVINAWEGKQPVYFEKVKGYSTPMVAGLGGDRTTMADSMGITPDQLVPKLIDAIVNPIPTTKMSVGPVHDNVALGEFSIDEFFPVPTYHAKDAGPYFVSGVMVVKDPSGIKRYTSIRRMQYLGGNRCAICITSPELNQQYQALEDRNQPLEVAVMFGVVPAVVLSSQISTHLYHADKLDVAGALLGTSLPVVQCKTVDIDVLADAEIVLEGRILPHERYPEGPFGEVGGYYGVVEENPVMEFTAITYQNHPIAQTIFPSSFEERIPMSIVREANLLNAVRQTVPNVLAVHVTATAVARLHAIIQIEKKTEGDAKQALLAAFSSDKDLKLAIVVNEDIDIFDPADVEWAIGTRMQADLDVFIVPGAKGSPLEPSHNLRGVTAKMGMDATYPLSEKERFIRTSIPVPSSFNIQDYL